MSVGSHSRWTRRRLAAQAGALGLASGDSVMVHAGLRSVGRILSGPDSLIGALLDVIGPMGTLLVYTDWDDDFHALLDETDRIPAELRDDIAPFDPVSSRARRDHGAIAEMIRTWPGALRSRNAGASCAAIGGRAAWFVSDHAYDYGYGEQSPFGKLVEVSGKVLMIGAPLDTMSLLHHAEHKARIPGKRVITGEVPLRVGGQVVWREYQEFDTSDPVVAGLEDGYFADIVESYLAQGKGTRGPIGEAASVLVSAPEIVAFAVDWLETRCGVDRHASEK